MIFISSGRFSCLLSSSLEARYPISFFMDSGPIAYFIYFSSSSCFNLSFFLSLSLAAFSSADYLRMPLIVFYGFFFSEVFSGCPWVED